MLEREAWWRHRPRRRDGVARWSRMARRGQPSWTCAWPPRSTTLCGVRPRRRESASATLRGCGSGFI